MQPAVGGTWHNQHGSTLELVVDESGLVRGTFRTAIGLASKQEPSRVTGFASGDLISFVARFEPYGCLTAWIGSYSRHDGKESIETLWHMTAMALDTWRSIWSGADSFHREPAVVRAAPAAMPSHPTVQSHGPPRP